MHSETPELEGFDYIRFTGAVTTCDLLEDEEIPERSFPFGFRAPEVLEIVVEVPELSSQAWGRWLP